MSVKPYIRAVVAALALGAALPVQSQPPGSPSPSAEAAKPNVSAPAWKHIFENGQSVGYVDKTSIGHDVVSPDHPKAISMTGLLDFKVAQVVNDHQVLSVVFFAGFDCGQKDIISLGSTYYGQNMGAGEAVDSGEGMGIWHAPQPGTFEDSLWNAACGK